MFEDSLMINQMSAGGGIEAVRTRVQQLNTMIQTVQKQSQTTAPASSSTAPSFKSFLGDTTAPPKLQPLDNSMADRKAELQPLVKEYSAQYGVDPTLVNAVIRQESGYNPNAVSSVGAQGLMQLMPSTARGLGVNNAFDPAQNLAGGVKHLAGLISKYNGNIPLALAAYNAGGGAVDKYNGIPPYAETRNYVQKILTAYLAAKNAS